MHPVGERQWTEYSRICVRTSPSNGLSIPMSNMNITYLRKSKKPNMREWNGMLDLSTLSPLKQTAKEFNLFLCCDEQPRLVEHLHTETTFFQPFYDSFFIFRCFFLEGWNGWFLQVLKSEINGGFFPVRHIKETISSVSKVKKRQNNILRLIPHCSSYIPLIARAGKKKVISNLGKKLCVYLTNVLIFCLLAFCLGVSQTDRSITWSDE